jgi:hypothetical protein
MADDTLYKALGEPKAQVLWPWLIPTVQPWAILKAKIWAYSPAWLLPHSPYIFPFFFSFQTGSHYVFQADLKLAILWPLPPKCWDYKCAPPGPDLLQAPLLGPGQGCISRPHLSFWFLVAQWPHNPHRMSWLTSSLDLHHVTVWKAWASVCEHTLSLLLQGHCLLHLLCLVIVWPSCSCHVPSWFCCLQHTHRVYIVCTM